MNRHGWSAKWAGWRISGRHESTWMLRWQARSAPVTPVLSDACPNSVGEPSSTAPLLGRRFRHLCSTSGTRAPTSPHSSIGYPWASRGLGAAPRSTSHATPDGLARLPRITSSKPPPRFGANHRLPYPSGRFLCCQIPRFSRQTPFPRDTMYRDISRQRASETPEMELGTRCDAARPRQRARKARVRQAAPAALRRREDLRSRAPK